MFRKPKLAKIFEDTQKFYSNNDILKENVKELRANTKFYEADEYPVVTNNGNRLGTITVTKSRTFEAAMRLDKEHVGKKIAVLNFASATTPGGGVVGGASAQEECLCRCSTLYPSIDRRWLRDKYYNVNRTAHNPLYTDAIIYSPNVIICKTDEDFPVRMNDTDFVSVDVITCAAPNLSHVEEVSSDELFDIHLRRARHILQVAAANGVDVLVLGAFGCGAFSNPPKVVATAYKIMLEEFREFFDAIEFAIYCRDFEMENYTVFNEVMSSAQ